jgi:outer membrane biosynthesis protein TonB
MSAAPKPVQGKVIRVGVVQGGQIVQEQRLRPGEPLTIGGAEDALVRCSVPGLPRRYTLIEQHRGRYRLRIPKQLEGKLSHGGRSVRLAELRERKPARRGCWLLELDDRSRGSIQLGAVTLLFQLVQAPPVGLRELSRPSFRPRLISDDDPVFLGFLGLFTVMASGFVAYTSSVQTPALLTDPKEIQRIAQVYLPAPELDDPEPIEPEPVDDSLAQAGTEPAEAEPEPEPAEAVASAEPMPERPLTPQEARAAEAQRKEDLRAEVYAKSKTLQILATLGNSNAGFLDPTVAFDGLETDADYDANGGRTASTVFETNWKEVGTTGTGREDTKIEIGPATSGNADITDAGALEITSTVIGEPPTMPEGGPDAAKVSAAVKGYYPRVKTCYERRLKIDPNLRGRLVIEWTVSAGKAIDIYVTQNSTGDAALEDCVTDSMRYWRFPTEIVDFPVSYPFVLAPG